MNFIDLIKVELLKIKRAKFLPLLFLAPLLVISSGIASLQSYLTPEYTNAWAAMFIQGALVYSYYLLPFTMIVMCVMIMGRESENNGILKMLSLPLSKEKLCLAKFSVLVLLLVLNIAIFMATFAIGGMIATNIAGINETLPFIYLIKKCLGIFFTMLPALSLMWMISVVFESSLITIALNLFLVIPGVLVANFPIKYIYPYCYSGSFISASLFDFTQGGENLNYNSLTLIICGSILFIICLTVACQTFGNKERN